MAAFTINLSIKEHTEITLRKVRLTNQSNVIIKEARQRR